MARKPLTNPRKYASQDRSRATVDALVEATARILIREGFDKASTNRIAEVAGVSVGSLYQYFPSKEALVAALIDRHNQEIRQIVQGELVEAVNAPVEQAVRKLVAVAIKAHRIDPRARTLVFSDSLDIDKVLRLHAHFRGRCRVAFGVGTNLTNDLGPAPLNIVMKMVRCNGQPVAKVSDSPGKGMCDDPGYLAYLRQVFGLPAADGQGATG